MTEHKLSEQEIKPFPFYGYAPGNYMNTCACCKKEMYRVDKLCFVCLECAIKANYAALTRERERVNIMVEALEKISEDYYPESVFSPISEDEWDEVVEYLAKGGYKIDSISGHYGRIFHKMHRDIAQTALNNYKNNK